MAPPEPPAANATLRGDLGPLAVLFLATLATRAIWFGDPVTDFDEQLYSLIGWRMTHGALPYVDLWDRKPLGLFAIFAAAHALFGPEAAAYQLVAGVAALAGAWLVYALARVLVDRVTATVAGVLYLGLMALYGSGSGQSEIFFVPLMLAMLWLVRDWGHPHAVRRSLVAMLVGGLALQVKYTVLPQCLFFGGYALYGQWRQGARFGRVAGLSTAFAALGIAPTALVALLYLGWGHFDAFWSANFVSFFHRAPSPSGRLHEGLLIQITPLAPLSLLGLFASFRLRQPDARRTYGLFAGWMLAALATVFLPGTIYLYYFAALVAPAVLLSLPLIDRKGFLGLAPAVLLLAALWWLLKPPARYLQSLEERRAAARLSAAIAPHVGATADCLFVFDGPAVLYRTTGTCLPSRYIYPDHLNNALEARALGIDQPAEIRRILAARPGAIVTANVPVTLQRAGNLKLVGGAIRRDYRPAITIALQDREITAWVRRDLARR